MTEEKDEDALDVEQIMAEIREEIAHRRQSGELVEPDLRTYRPFQSIPPELEAGLYEINTCWNRIYEPWTVRSRLPVLGTLWAAVRRRLHGEVRAYLDPMVWRQVDFNAAVVRSLNVLVRELYGPLPTNLQAMNRELLSLRREVQALRKELQELRAAAQGDPDNG